TKVADPYRWMENTSDPELQTWVEAENTLTQSYIGKIAFRAQVAKRLRELLDYPRMGLPEKYGTWLFYTKNSSLQNQSVYYKQKGDNGTAETLLDPNTLSKDGTVAVSALSYTADGKLMGYGLSQSGSDWQTLHVRDVATGKDRPDLLEHCRFSAIAWLPDDSGFYYSRYPDAGTVPKGEEEFWQKCYFHKLGDAQKKDRLVYERTDCRECGASPGVSDDGHWLIMHVWKGTAAENWLYVQRLGQPGTQLEPLFTGFDAAWNFIESQGEKLYFQTDKDAPKNRVIVVDMAGDKKPVSVIPEAADVLSSAKIANGEF